MYKCVWIFQQVTSFFIYILPFINPCLGFLVIICFAWCVVWDHKDRTFSAAVDLVKTQAKLNKYRRTGCHLIRSCSGLLGLWPRLNAEITSGALRYCSYSGLF